MIREVVKIDEEKCNGCGQCVPSCAEGAIKIIDGKARLVADNLCDGLGACLGTCPMDAITIERREADEFDEEAVEKHLGDTQPPKPHHHPSGGGCPSARIQTFGHGHGGCPSASPVTIKEKRGGDQAGQRPTELRQWPVQMHLVPPTAPFLKGADLLLAADCVPFAYPEFHRDILKGKALLIGCPKLDDGQAYLQKLTAILQQNDIARLTVAHMEVPCCSGLIALARQAIVASGCEVALETVCVGIQGELK